MASSLSALATRDETQFLRNHLPLHLEMRSGTPIIVYEHPNSLVPSSPLRMEEPGTSRVGQLVVKLYKCYRDLEQELSPYQRRVEELEEELAMCKARLLSSERTVSQYQAIARKKKETNGG